MPITFTIELSDEQMDALAERIAAKVARVSAASFGAPVPIKDAGPMVGKSVKHLRREVDAGRIKRVPGISRVLIPISEIQRLQQGEAIVKRRPS